MFFSISFLFLRRWSKLLLYFQGLFQNVFLLYKMFDSAGWTPILIVNTKPTNLEKVPEVLRTTRVLSIEDLVKQPLPIKAYIEIGMSIDPQLRRDKRCSDPRNGFCVHNRRSYGHA